MEIKAEIKRHLVTKVIKDTTFQNFQETAKAVVREKYIAIQANREQLK